MAANGVSNQWIHSWLWGESEAATVRGKTRGTTRNGAPRLPRRWLPPGLWLAIVLPGLLATGGCWAPLCSKGIPACNLPDSFRTPSRTAGPPLNFAALAIPPQPDYILGRDDVLEVTVHGLYPGADTRPIRTQIMADGKIHLPVVGSVHVGGMNLTQAHVAINEAYAGGFIKQPRTNVFLAQKATINVMVLGTVGAPGMYTLPKYENDVAHALAVAGGILEDSSMEIEVHRRIPPDQVEAAGYSQGEYLPPTAAAASSHGYALGTNPASTLEVVTPPDPTAPAPLPAAFAGAAQFSGQLGKSPLGIPLMQEPMKIVKIPLRGYPSEPVFSSDIVLQQGDVVYVPSRKDEVFFVVGRLSPTNFVRFSISERERDLGTGFLLPRDREIDVVTAVAMAGYIDPIESPTTVTVHRRDADGRSLLILVDLIKARYDRRETVLVEPGDIIYLNPDAAWWFRKTFDRIVVSLFTVSYRKALNFGN